MAPATMATIEVSITAPAIISLISLTYPFIRGFNTSVILSTALLTNSANNTNPITKTSNTHSKEVMPTYHPKSIITTAAKDWTCRFCSSLHVLLIPRKA